MTEYSILLSDPDISAAELAAVEAVLSSPRLSQGPRVEQFEAAFAGYLGRRHAVAVASGTLGLLLALQAQGIGTGDEVICSPFGWHQIAQAIGLAGATPVFSDIDYWSGCLNAEKLADKLTPRTRAVLAGNVAGHPAAWGPLRAFAAQHGLLLLEDSTEALGSRYQGQLVGSFGDCAVFDFSQPSALCCGEGGMVVTDDADVALRLRALRNRRLDERFSVSVSAHVPWQAGMSELSAALGMQQLQRLPQMLTRRKRVEQYYADHILSFEGIKPPYIAPEVDEVHWFLYLVHLGTRFSKSSRGAIVSDLHTAGVEAAAYCQPLHQQRHYLDRKHIDQGYRRGQFPVTEKIADRALVLPFHAHLGEDQVSFIVQTAKDASINVGAGAAIYL
ncbi:MAG: DegT/DnrJ/EryC1/StrS family aminotransferase [Gammaproteobacteria bacterium]|nr:DegT/DnrJ/EryC1/StrS family aminotransferase [Gammaproteobacteria bacterium]